MVWLNFIRDVTRFTLKFSSLLFIFSREAVAFHSNPAKLLLIQSRKISDEEKCKNVNFYEFKIFFEKFDNNQNYQMNDINTVLPIILLIDDLSK